MSEYKFSLPIKVVIGNPDIPGKYAEITGMFYPEDSSWSIFTSKSGTSVTIEIEHASFRGEELKRLRK